MYRDMLGADVSGEQVCNFFSSLYFYISSVQALPEHGVTTVFVNLSNTKLELLHPLGEKSPIAGFLEKNKAGGIHHICIEVRTRANAITIQEKDVFYPFPKSVNGPVVQYKYRLIR